MADLSQTLFHAPHSSMHTQQWDQYRSAHGQRKRRRLDASSTSEDPGERDGLPGVDVSVNDETNVTSLDDNGKTQILSAGSTSQTTYYSAKDAVDTRPELGQDLDPLASSMQQPLAPSRSGVRGLRQQHMSTLTAILHISLLRGDYARAGRAWGLLLRTDVQGALNDPRFANRWGIGAEVALRRLEGLAAPREASPTDDVSIISESRNQTAKLDPSRPAEYYMGMSVLFDIKKTRRDEIDEIDFKFARFTHLLQTLVKYGHVPDESTGSELSEMDLDANDDSMKSKEPERLLNSAREIAEDLKETLQSPLYSRHAVFTDLQCMLRAWILDLEAQISAQTPDEYRSRFDR